MNLFTKLLIALMLLATVGLVIILNFTTPAQAGAVGILSAFILAYIVVVSVMSFFMYGIAKILFRAVSIVGVNPKLTPLTLRRAYYFSSVIGLAPVLLLSMQSVGTLSVYEFGLVFLLVMIGCVYVAKRTD